jgi:1-acyl-sn-glycerol-3-phosphate acyltransferase
VSWRAARRGLVLALSLLFCYSKFGWVSVYAAVRGRAVMPPERAEWMHFCGRMVLAAMGIRYRVEGDLPAGPALYASNHLSYLDIAIASAAAPFAFVAKREIAGWPGFGVLARIGGAIFLDRVSRVSAWDAADRMAERLAEGVSVMFFPEGTSTDGREVHRFHSTLFAPAVEAGWTVVPVAIFYQPHGGDETERDVCWFGDESFLPHLKHVLGLKGFDAVIRFGKAESYPDRRTAAWRSHDAVETMRKQGTGA